MYRHGNAGPLVDDGIAPLPVLLSTAAPSILEPADYSSAIRLARTSAILLIGVPLVFVAYGSLRPAVGRRGAAAGTALLTFSPNLVAHTSVATTDVCFVVGALLGLAALARYVEYRSPGRLAALALTFGVALAAKYSAIALWPALFAVLVASERGAIADRLRRGFATASLVAVVSLALVWALHGFAMLPVKVPALASVRVPAVIAGVASQAIHQRGGHPAFLLGQTSSTGWWYYTPVAIALKSSPAELVLMAFALIGLIAGLRSGGVHAVVWRAAFVSFALFAFLNRLDLGIRYVLLLLPLSMFLAIEWLHRVSTPIVFGTACAVLLVMQVASAVAIAPHDLSYFNRIAGGPAIGWRYLADSNIDWGQDLPALRDQVTRLGGGRVLLSYFGNAPLEAYGVAAKMWDANDQRNLGEFEWVAISVTHLDGLYVPSDLLAPFRSIAPSARAGYSILIYSTRRPEVRAAMSAVARRWRTLP
jgi:dolichyl-phosphate-mannose-protein mannosyltransferase